MNATVTPPVETPRAAPPARVLAIVGSLRRESFNRRLLRVAIAHAPPSLQIASYEDLAALPVFDQDLEADTGGGPPVVRALRDDVNAADALLFVTPEYNQSIPGVLKNAIDWLSRATPDEPLDGKPAAIMGATPGRWGTRHAQRELRHVLAGCGALVMPMPQLYVRDAGHVITPENTLADPPAQKTLVALLAAFATWIARLRAPLAQA